MTDSDSVAAICEKYSPDVVIHCAGIAHQKIGAIDSVTYMRVNSEATETLAKAAAESNPGVCFVFFSSVSVYEEHPQITQISQIVSNYSAKAFFIMLSCLLPSPSTGSGIGFCLEIAG